MKNNLYKNNLVPINLKNKHILRIMKMVFISLFVFISGIFATEANSQNTKISISKDNANIQEVINAIEKQTDYLFIYNKKEVNVNQRVSVHATNKTVAEVLHNIFENTEISYAMQGNNIMLMKREKPENNRSITISQQSGKTITGKIVDAKGEPIIGANVIIKGTTNGMISDVDGKFTLQNVPNNAVVQVSYIGYLTQNIRITSQSSLNVTLIEDTQKLNEVVVVGYGTQKKSNLTGSVSSIKPSEYNDLNLNVQQTIQGRVAGVDVSNNKIIIRGAASIHGSDPLWIVDGVPGSEPNFNDIESIEILKDAASTAIYGAQGAGGVILVTTKKGKVGKISVNAMTNFGIKTAIDRPDMLHRDDYIKAKLAAGFSIPVGSGWEDASSLPDTDWNKVIWRNAWQQNHFVQLTGGTERTTFNSSMEYHFNKGLLLDNKSEGGTLRMASTTKVTDNFDVAEVISMNYDNTNPVAALDGGNDFFYYRQTPMMAVYDTEDGGYGKDPAGGYYSGVNQLQSIKTNHINSKTYKTTGDLILTYKPIKGLTLQANLYGQIYSYAYNRFQEYCTTNVSTTNQSYTKTYTTGHQLRMLYTGTYEKTIADNHNFKIMGGYEAYKKYYTGAGGWADGFAVQPSEDMTLATGSTKVYGGTTQGRSISMFGRFNYDYANKYLFEASIRRDGYDNFGTNNRFGVFPSLSLGWNIAKENFMADNKIFSNLKLRGSWGQIGNNTIDQFLYETAWTNSGLYEAYQDGKIVRGFRYTGIANPNIKWETVTQWNVGLDWGLLNGKLNGTVEYYDKKTTNMLYDVGVPTSSGSYATSLTTNIGKIDNKGLEVSIGWRDSYKDLHYSVDLNISHNNNKVERLSDDINTVLYYGATTGKFLSSPYRTEAGKPMGQLWGYVCDGIFQSNDEVAALNAKAPSGHYQYAGTAAGDLKWRDLNGDGQITEADRTYIGNPWPKYTLGANINLSYKGFDLMMAWTGAFKVDLFNSIKFYERQFYTSFSSTYKVFDGWSETNTGAKNPRVTMTDPNYNFSTVSSYFVENGAYLKLKTLHFGYNLPKNIISKIGFEKVKFYVNLENPIIFTKFQGDPELGGSYLRRNEYGSNFIISPQTRSFMGGISLTY